jgi:hypothetical protein
MPYPNGVNDFSPHILTHSSSKFVQRCPQNFIQRLGFSWKSAQCKSHFTTGRKWISMLAFQIYYPVSVEFGTSALHRFSWKSAQWKSHFTTGRKRISMLALQIYYLVSVEFRTSALHLILLSICYVCGNRRREGRTFVMAVYKITFMPYTMKPYHILNAKEIKNQIHF